MSLNTIIDEHVINISQESNFYFAKAPEGNVGAVRYLDLIVLDGDDPYVIPSDVDIVIAGTNGGGLTIFESCQKIASNKIRVTLSPTILGASGLGKYRIEFYNTGNYDSSGLLSSFNFNIQVTKAPYDISALANSSQFSELADLVQVARNVTTWRTGSGVPSDALGNNSDLYLDTDTCDVYKKVNSVWSYLTNIKGQSNYLYLMYSEHSDGTDLHDTPVDGDHYLGICNSTSSTKPTTKESYNWMFLGRDSLATAYVDLTTGELIYSGGTLQFSIDENGYLVYGEA